MADTNVVTIPIETSLWGRMLVDIEKRSYLGGTMMELHGELPSLCWVSPIEISLWGVFLHVIR